MDNFLVLSFQLFVLLFSIIIHEVSHGIMALRLGDTTARDAGRLTLNPAKHLDLFGSFLVPISLFLLSGGSFVLGWAKPVPYNPHQLKNPKLGAGLIGLAGPLSNLVMAVVFAVLIRLLMFLPLAIIPTMVMFLNFIIFLNLVLAIFNLLPIPPLDGANILFSVLPERLSAIQRFLERYGFFLLILFIFFGFRYLFPLIYKLYSLLALT